MQWKEIGVERVIKQTLPEHSLRLSGPDTWYLPFKSFVMQLKETGVERVIKRILNIHNEKHWYIQLYSVLGNAV